MRLPTTLPPTQGYTLLQICQKELFGHFLHGLQRLQLFLRFDYFFHIEKNQLCQDVETMPKLRPVPKSHLRQYKLSFFTHISSFRESEKINCPTLHLIFTSARGVDRLPLRCRYVALSRGRARLAPLSIAKWPLRCSHSGTSLAQRSAREIGKLFLRFCSIGTIKSNASLSTIWDSLFLPTPLMMVRIQFTMISFYIEFCKAAEDLPQMFYRLECIQILPIQFHIFVKYASKLL